MNVKKNFSGKTREEMDVVESDCGISGTDVQRKFKRMKIAEEQGTSSFF